MHGVIPLLPHRSLAIQACSLLLGCQPGPTPERGQRRGTDRARPSPLNPRSSSTAGSAAIHAGPGGPNVVVLALGTLRALHVGPRRGTGFDWPQPGKGQAEKTPAVQAGAGQTSRACQGSSEADPSRIK